MREFPGLHLDVDPVERGASLAENVEFRKSLELSKRGGLRRLNHRRYSGAILALPDVQRICDYGKYLVFSDDPTAPEVYEHGDGTGGTLNDVFFNPGWPLVVVAAANPDNGLIPLTVQFSSLGSMDPNGGTLSYSWDFGDGVGANEPNPEHTYATAGPYNVTLTVSASGRTASTVIVVSPVDPWSVDYTPSATALQEVFADGANTMVCGTAAFRTRAGANNWGLHSNAPSAWNPQDPRGALSFGGLLYLSRNFRVYVWNGAAWVQDTMVPGVTGTAKFTTLGGTLRCVSDQNITYRMNAPGVWVAEPASAVGALHFLSLDEFDNAIYNVDGYFQVVGGNLVYTLVGPVGLQGGGYTVWNGRLWGVARSAPTGALYFKTARADPGTGLGVPAGHGALRCIKGDNGLYVLMLRAADNHSRWYRWDGTDWHFEYDAGVVDGTMLTGQYPTYVNGCIYWPYSVGGVYHILRRRF